MRRVAIGAPVVVGVALVVVLGIAVHGALTPLLAVAALVLLIAGGNLLYGKNSHGAAAEARTRPAQEAQNRAIDEARRKAAEEAAEG